MSVKPTPAEAITEKKTSEFKKLKAQKQHLWRHITKNRVKNREKIPWKRGKKLNENASLISVRTSLRAVAGASFPQNQKSALLRYTQHQIWNVTQTTHSNSYPGGVFRTVRFFVLNVLKVYPGGVVFVLKYLKFKSIPRGCRFFEFCSFKTMGFCEGTACVHALTAATHNINIMSSNAKEKKKSWRLNFLLTCVKYSSALSAPKPFVQTSF